MLCYVGAGFRPAPIFLYLSDVCNKRAGLKPAPTMIIVIF